jgi:hypothetical protein
MDDLALSKKKYFYIFKFYVFLENQDNLNVTQLKILKKIIPIDRKSTKYLYC